jgi:hypothetical protein
MAASERIAESPFTYEHSSTMAAGRDDPAAVVRLRRMVSQRGLTAAVLTRST